MFNLIEDELESKRHYARALSANSQRAKRRSIFPTLGKIPLRGGFPGRGK
jgi:hypothetical protein